MANTLSKFVFEKVGVPTYRKFLDLSAFRHKLISGNIANISTPGYKARDIDFKAEFARLTTAGNHLAVEATNAHHISTGNHEARAPKPEQEKVAVGEMNSVDIDREASNLAQNELLYTVGARLLQRKFDGIRKAITSK